MRLYDYSGDIVGDVYGHGRDVTSFITRSYLTTNYPCTTLYPDVWWHGCPYSGNWWATPINHPFITTGGGGPSIIPGNVTHAAEIAVDQYNIATGMIGYTVAFYN
jgi:hypothetical protein